MYFAPPPSRALARRVAILCDQRGHAIPVADEGVAAGADLGLEDVHRDSGGGGYQPQQSVLKRHCGQRHTACMRYISAPQRSHTAGSSTAGAGRAWSADSTGVIGGNGGNSAMAGL